MMVRLGVVALVLSLAVAVAASGLGDVATPDGGVAASPYRVWWSFPNDDITAIEVDDADLSAEGRDRWATRADFAVAMQVCDFKRSRRLAKHKDGTPVREIRVEPLTDHAKPATRCVMTLKQWRARIGKDLVYRLDDELDAHEAFLLPRRGPGMPAKVKLPPDGGIR
jgi:hypothetical protein